MKIVLNADERAALEILTKHPDGIYWQRYNLPASAIDPALFNDLCERDLASWKIDHNYHKRAFATSAGLNALLLGFTNTSEAAAHIRELETENARLRERVEALELTAREWQGYAERAIADNNAHLLTIAGLREQLASGSAWERSGGEWRRVSVNLEAGQDGD